MKIVQLTPGAGKMVCGNCFRDHALVVALRKLGHSALMVPLYLPATLESEESDRQVPIFFSGVSVYLEQKSAIFRHAPRWARRLLSSKWLLNRVAGAAASTVPTDLGELTVSMLRGEEGRQAQEIEDLVGWLKSERPDVICLSNALLIGMARRLKAELGVPVVCTLQGEDEYLDALTPPFNSEAWEVLRQRAADVDLFIAPSRYFAQVMSCRLAVSGGRIPVVYNGIDLEGFAGSGLEMSARGPQPLIGFLGRMCSEKGLDVLVEAFVKLRQRGTTAGLRIAGYCGPRDMPFVEKMKDRLAKEGLLGEVEFFPNISRAEKLAFLRSLSVFSTPAIYSEAFGLYVLEAMAAGVAVVQPDHSAFPELIEATGGGVLCKRKDSDSLAVQLETLISDPKRARELGEAGRRAVFERFGVERMAREIAGRYKGLVS